MTDYNAVVFARTNYDDATRVLHDQVAEPMIEYAHKRLFSYVDLSGGGATRTNLEGSIIRYNPQVLMVYSHGHADYIVGQDGFDLLSLANAVFTNGKVCYFCACHTGEELAQVCVDNGAPVVFAFDDVLTILVVEQEGGGYLLVDAFQHCLTKPKLLFDNWKARDVYQAVIDEFNRWIDYYDNVDPFVADTLRHDRDHFKMYGNGESVVQFNLNFLVGITDILMYVNMVLIALFKVVQTYKRWRK